MSFLSEFQIMVKVNPIRKRGRPSSSAAEEQAGSSGKRPARARRAPSRLRDGVDDTPTPSTSKQAHAPPSTAAQDIPIISPAIQKLMTQCISEVTSAFMEQERQLMATFTENILASQTPPAARNEPSDPVSVMPTRASPPPPAAAPQPDNPPLLVTPARAPDVREPEPSTSNTNVSTLMPRPGTSNSPSESPVPVPITFGCPTVRPLQAGGMPLGGAIPERVKEKIWQNKYIELADLLPSDRQSYTLQIYNDSDTPSLNFEPKKRRRLTEAEWIRAFDIYIAIYIDKYPDAANALLTYTHNVQNIMAAGGDWQHYDSKFRQEREFSLVSWYTVRPDLEIQAFRPNRTFREKFPPKFNGQSQQRLPRGYCYDYHSRGTRCTRRSCSYKHTCPKCDQPHPVYFPCRQRPDQKPDNNKDGKSGPGRTPT